MFSVPAVLALGCATTVYAGQLAWRSAPAPSQGAGVRQAGASVAGAAGAARRDL